MPASCSAAPGLVLGADVLTSRGSHVYDPEAKSRTRAIPLMPLPWLVLHSPPGVGVCCSNLAGNAWVECQMLFLLGIYGSCLTHLSDVLRLHMQEQCRKYVFCCPLLYISISSHKLLNYLWCRHPIKLSLTLKASTVSHFFHFQWICALVCTVWRDGSACFPTIS